MIDPLFALRLATAHWESTPWWVYAPLAIMPIYVWSLIHDYRRSKRRRLAVDHLFEDRGRLRLAIVKYGAHEWGCEARKRSVKEPAAYVCTCGLDRVLW